MQYANEISSNADTIFIMLAQLVVRRRRSWELASSIPAMVDFADIVAIGSTKQ